MPCPQRGHRKSLSVGVASKIGPASSTHLSGGALLVVIWVLAPNRLLKSSYVMGGLTPPSGLVNSSRHGAADRELIRFCRKSFPRIFYTQFEWSGALE